MEPVKVLVVMASEKTLRTKYCVSLLPEDLPQNYKFVFQISETTETQVGASECTGFASLQECLEDAERIVASEKITAVLSRSDAYADALVCAALTQKFPDLLRGPSVEAIFLANNKYYTRCVLDPDPIPFARIDLSLPSQIRTGCERPATTEAVRNVGVPREFLLSSSPAQAKVVLESPVYILATISLTLPSCTSTVAIRLLHKQNQYP